MTQVVENHVAALAEQIDGKIVLVSDGRNDGLSPSTIDQIDSIQITGLSYDRPSDGPMRSSVDSRWIQAADQIADEIHDQLAARKMSPADTVLHWHNHSLGKNVAQPRVIGRLTHRYRFGQLLQIHDFAEDFRPQNYLRLVLAAITDHQANSTSSPIDAISSEGVNRYCFPDSPLVRYATLTQSDCNVLSRVGVHLGQIHVLPNSVGWGEAEIPNQAASLNKLRGAFSLPGDARWCVYPVRGIRRKNLGEFLLLSHLLPESTYCGITLPPTTKIERDSYERWKSLASEVAPRTVFDAGTHAEISFLENLSASDFILSTSVAEGFGMAFLEPWLAGRGVVARRLDHVVSDFEARGINLDRFYRAVLIPGQAQWIADCLVETEQAFDDAWQDLADHFGHAWRVNRPPLTCESDAIDFATLTPRRQIEVLRRIAADRGFKAAVRNLNPVLCQSLASPFETTTLESNADLVLNRYGVRSSGASLIKIYRELVDQNCSAGHVPPTNLRSIDRDQKEPASRWAVNLIASERPFFPCRVEQEIAV